MGKFALQSGIGSLGEELGCRYLKQKGYTILATNYCNTSGRRLGEIDIVARKGKELIFVEVKTRFRTPNDTLVPEASITPAKLHKLERIAAYYLHEQRLESFPYHFDALSIVYDTDAHHASIRHLEHIFF